MPSRVDQALSNEWPRTYEPFLEEVTRRLLGDEHQTETVRAVVERDQAAVNSAAQRGGFISDERGDYIEVGALIEIDRNQPANRGDQWIIDGQTYKQVGTALSEDGASKTIVVVLRYGKRGRRSMVDDFR